MLGNNWKYKGNTTNPNKPIWDEYVDSSGKSSLEVLTPKKVWEACKKHYFETVDNLGNLQCRNCSFGQRIIWGIHILKKGKIIKLKRG